MVWKVTWVIYVGPIFAKVGEPWLAEMSLTYAKVLGQRQSVWVDPATPEPLRTHPVLDIMLNRIASSILPAPSPLLALVLLFGKSDIATI